MSTLAQQISFPGLDAVEAAVEQLSNCGIKERCAIFTKSEVVDFILAPLPQAFTYVIGTPPYVRQELIPDVLMAEYRRLYKTIYDRADLYIPFIERSLSLLSKGGTLGFICADRWMKNRYGGPLRQ